MVYLTRSLIYNAADARLRIVSERVDIVDNLIISVSVILYNCILLNVILIGYLFNIYELYFIL